VLNAMDNTEPHARPVAWGLMASKSSKRTSIVSGAQATREASNGTGWGRLFRKSTSFVRGKRSSG
jgi:hypothetical protein